MSKEDYIKILDSRCADMKNRNKDSNLRVLDLIQREGNAYSQVIENFTEAHDLKKDLAAINIPNEDADTLRKFWTQLWANDELLTRRAELMKEEIKLVDELNAVLGEDSKTQAAKIDRLAKIKTEYSNIRDRLVEGRKELGSIALKYGFRICGTLGL
jgi:hypothetical protein